MGKIYSPGDVVFFKNVMLVNHNGATVLDPRIKGHPYIILNDVDDFGEVALCLNCSSSKKGKRKNSHVMIENLKIRGDRRRSTYANIKNLYKFQIDQVIISAGRVSKEVLNDLIKRVQDKI